MKLRVWTYKNAILTQYPARALTGGQKRSISLYSREVLGSPDYIEWLELYTIYRGEFIEGWIPGGYYSNVLAKQWYLYKGFQRKVFSKRLMGTESLPDLAYFINGFWLDRDNNPIDAKTAKDIAFASSPHVFVKSSNSIEGSGVWKMSHSEFDPNEVAKIGDVVLQAPIHQHPALAAFNAESVATLRITTVKPLGQRAQLRASYLRLARENKAVIRSTEALRVPVVSTDGALCERGADAVWRSISAHPDSGVEFRGFKIPGYQRAVRFCETLHDRNPFQTLIGWDIAIDPECEPVLIEWNQNAPSITFSEASVGPCFAGLGWESAWK